MTQTFRVTKGSGVDWLAEITIIAYCIYGEELTFKDEEAFGFIVLKKVVATEALFQCPMSPVASTCYPPAAIN